MRVCDPALGRLQELPGKRLERVLRERRALPGKLQADRRAPARGLHVGLLRRVLLLAARALEPRRSALRTERVSGLAAKASRAVGRQSAVFTAGGGSRAARLVRARLLGRPLTKSASGRRAWRDSAFGGVGRRVRVAVALGVAVTAHLGARRVSSAVRPRVRIVVRQRRAVTLAHRRVVTRPSRAVQRCRLWAVSEPRLLPDARRADLSQASIRSLSPRRKTW